MKAINYRKDFRFLRRKLVEGGENGSNKRRGILFWPRERICFSWRNESPVNLLRKTRSVKSSRVFFIWQNPTLIFSVYRSGKKWYKSTLTLYAQAPSLYYSLCLCAMERPTYQYCRIVATIALLLKGSEAKPLHCTSNGHTWVTVPRILNGLCAQQPSFHIQYMWEDNIRRKSASPFLHFVKGQFSQPHNCI